MLTLMMLLAPALAHDASTEGCPQCLYEELATQGAAERPERGPDTTWDLFGAAGMIYFGEDVASPWAMMGIEGWRGLYVRGEGRAHPDRKWMGRVAAGFDFLPRQEGLDVTLGAYAGNAAVWNSLESQTTQVGTEVGLAVHVDRTHARVRLLGGPNSATGTLRREAVWSLGYRLLPILELQAQAVVLNPGTPAARETTGVGLSGAVVF